MSISLPDNITKRSLPEDVEHVYMILPAIYTGDVWVRFPVLIKFIMMRILTCEAPSRGANPLGVSELRKLVRISFS